MGDRWVENFFPAFEKCVYPIVSDISVMKFFVTEFFVKIGKNAVHCKFLRKVS